MMTIQNTANALIQRFTQNGWRPLTLTIKATGDKVTITPCIYDGTDTAETVNDCEYFLMDCATINLCGADTIEEIADQLNNFAETKAQDIDDKQRLKQFYQTNLAGFNKHDFQMSHIAYDLIECQKLSIEEAATQMKVSIEDANKYITLSHSFSFYSDWHKDLFGFRPHSLFC